MFRIVNAIYGESGPDPVEERLARIESLWNQDYRTEFLYLLGKMAKAR